MPKISEMNRPVVSVVMPAYNAEKTVEAAVRSVLSQTFQALELIVCNDASIDRTVEILAAIGDPRLRVIHNAKNMGEGATRDNAIEMAEAQWLAVIDADDVWAPDRLKHLLEYAKDESQMVFDDLMICHDVDGALVPWRPLRGSGAFGSRREMSVEITLEDYIRAERLLIKPIMPAAVIKRHGLKHSDKKFGADSEFFIRLMGLGVRARFVPAPLYLYRIAPGSMTAIVKRPAAMRLCLEECRQMKEWPDSVLRAFDDKISDLRRNETLYAIANSARQGSVLRILQHIIENPSVLIIMPRRVLKHLYYQLHRIFHGGVSR